jgi:hypothetical protein
MQAIIDEARESSSARFTLKLPGKIATTTGKVSDTDEAAAKWEIPRKDAKAHEAVLKAPLAMKATIAKKDAAPLLEKEKKAKAEKAEKPAEKPPAADRPGSKLGD